MPGMEMLNQLLADTGLQLRVAAALCCVVVVLLCYWVGPSNAPPGPRFVLPIIGETLELLTVSPLKFQWKRVQKYGLVFRTHIIGQTMYWVADPDALRRIVKLEGVKWTLPSGAINRILTRMDQQHDRKWHQLWRKYHKKALDQTAIASYFPALQSIVDRRVAHWEAKGRVPLMDEVFELSLDFGVDVIAGLELPDTVDRAWFKERAREIILGLLGLPYDVPGSALNKCLKAKRAVGQALAATINQEVARMQEKLAEDGHGLLEDNARVGLFDATMMCNHGFTDLTVELGVERITGNLIGAVDTTKTMIWIVLSLVAKADRVRRLLREEQARVVAKHGPRVTYEAVQEMPYLDATVKECMRIMPASIFTFRETTEPFPVGKYVIPRGATIVLSSVLPQALDPVLWDGDLSKAVPPHMDWENNFDDAFRPERWLPDSDAKPRAYATFGGGDFQCLGMNLAYTEGKLLMATILRKYRYSFPDPDWINKSKFFPSPSSKHGADWMEFVPDPLPGC